MLVPPPPGEIRQVAGDVELPHVPHNRAPHGPHSQTTPHSATFPLARSMTWLPSHLLFSFAPLPSWTAIGRGGSDLFPGPLLPFWSQGRVTVKG